MAVIIDEQVLEALSFRYNDLSLENATLQGLCYVMPATLFRQGQDMPVTLYVPSPEARRDADAYKLITQQFETLRQHVQSVNVANAMKLESEGPFRALQVLVVRRNERTLLQAGVDARPVSDRLAVVRDLIGALAQLHQRGFIHGDLDLDAI